MRKYRRKFLRQCGCRSTEQEQNQALQASLKKVEERLQALEHANQALRQNEHLLKRRMKHYLERRGAGGFQYGSGIGVMNTLYYHLS
jgi:flagellar motility protein MotE (MotC chaperone)